MPKPRNLWLLSDGRSGSTWVAQMLAHRGDLRIEHEPVHRDFTAALAAEPILPLPCGVKSETLYRPLLERIMAGQRIARPSFDPGGNGTAGCIIRDINALFIAPRLLAAIPALEPVLLVRHPAQVALSKLALPHWHWFGDVDALRDNPDLARSVSGRSTWLDAATTPFRRHVIGWAVSHHYFFTHLTRAHLPIIRYGTPSAEMTSVIGKILGGIDQARFDHAHTARSSSDHRPPISLLRRLIGRPGPTRADYAFAEDVIDGFGLRWLVPTRMVGIAAPPIATPLLRQKHA